MRPRYIAYCMWMVIALLGVVCFFVPADGWTIGKWNLRFPTLAEALDLPVPTPDTLHFTPDTLEPTPDTIVSTPDTLHPTTDTLQQVLEPQTSTPHTLQSTPVLSTLAAFYQALDSADVMPVRVVHYGDSQIEEDRITNILRERWQQEYGGGGVGLIPLHQTIPTRSIRQRLSINGTVQTVQGGPKRYLVYGPRSMRLEDNDYGAMGQVAVLDSTLVPGSEDVILNIEPINKKLQSHNYFNRIRLLTDSVTASTSMANSSSTNSLITLPDSTTHCELHLQGKGKVYGISLETATGVIVDNIPMRGCSGNIFTRIDSASLSDFYRETNTRLIIMQFGGNMIPQTENTSTISGYVRTTLRQQIRYIRACAPQASILFIGPSDMSTNIDGKMTTYPLVPYMDQQLKKMAQEENIAYWSMYDAMGGFESMVTWHDKGLAGSDYVHFTRTGANNIGKKLYNWIMEQK